MTRAIDDTSVNRPDKTPWEGLSMAEKAALMKEAVNNGVYDLKAVRSGYDSFVKVAEPVVEEVSVPEPSVTDGVPLDKLRRSLEDFYVNIEPNVYAGGGNKGRQRVNPLKQQFLNTMEQALKESSSHNSAQWRKFLTDLADMESSYYANITNNIGAKGYFQLMPFNRAKSWSSPTQQFHEMFKLTDANLDYFKKNLTKEDWAKADRMGIDIYGLLAGAHLGGVNGALNALRGKGNAKDSNGTSVMHYMKKFSQHPSRDSIFSNLKRQLTDLKSQAADFVMRHSNSDVGELQENIFNTDNTDGLWHVPMMLPSNPTVFSNLTQFTQPSWSIPQRPDISEVFKAYDESKKQEELAEKQAERQQRMNNMRFFMNLMDYGKPKGDGSSFMSTIGMLAGNGMDNNPYSLGSKDNSSNSKGSELTLMPMFSNMYAGGDKIERRKGVKGGEPVEYYDASEVMPIVADNMGKSIVLDEVEVTPDRRLPIQDTLFEGITNQAANERADEFANRTSLTPERFLGLMGANIPLAAGALGATVAVPALFDSTIAPLSDYVAGTKAGQAVTGLLGNPYFNTAVEAGFAGHGLNHIVNDGVDGWGDAAMTALEMTPLGRLAKPVWNVVKPTRNFIPTLESNMNGVRYAYNRNPELANIGTLEDYNNYLKTVFPESKVRDINYHMGPKGLQELKPSTGDVWNTNPGARGIYVTPDKSYAQRIRKYTTARLENPSIWTNIKRNLTPRGWNKVNEAFTDIYPVMIDAKNPLYTKGIWTWGIKDKKYKSLMDRYDAIINSGPRWYHNVAYSMPESIVPKTEQALILGSDTDVAGFRRFMSNHKITAENAANITPEQWTAAQDAAIARGDMAEAQRLRDLHGITNGYKIRGSHASKVSNDFTEFNTGIKRKGTNRPPSIYDDYKDLTAGAFFGDNSRGAINQFGKTRDYLLRIDKPLQADAYNMRYDSLLPPGTTREDIIKEVNNLRSKGYTEEQIDSWIKGQLSYTTDDYALKVFNDNSYDGAIIKNIYEGHMNPDYMDDAITTTDYIITKPNQAKLRDAVTFDDNGVRIPLGERDNFEVNDIRYDMPNSTIIESRVSAKPNIPYDEAYNAAAEGRHDMKNLVGSKEYADRVRLAYRDNNLPVNQADFEIMEAAQNIKDSKLKVVPNLKNAEGKALNGQYDPNTGEVLVAQDRDNILDVARTSGHEHAHASEVEKLLNMLKKKWAHIKPRKEAYTNSDGSLDTEWKDYMSKITEMRAPAMSVWSGMKKLGFNKVGDYLAHLSRLGMKDKQWEALVDRYGTTNAKYMVETVFGISPLMLVNKGKDEEGINIAM